MWAIFASLHARPRKTSNQFACCSSGINWNLSSLWASWVSTIEKCISRLRSFRQRTRLEMISRESHFLNMQQSGRAAKATVWWRHRVMRPLVGMFWGFARIAIHFWDWISFHGRASKGKHRDLWKVINYCGTSGAPIGWASRENHEPARRCKCEMFHEQWDHVFL